MRSLDSDHDFLLNIQRSQFERICAPIFERLKKPLIKVLQDAQISRDEIDEVILVGGSTRIPWVKSWLEEYFGKQPNVGLNADEGVAHGATIMAGILSGVVDPNNTLTLLDVTPLSLGVECKDDHNSVIIKRNTAIPCQKTERYQTAFDYQDVVSVNVM